MSVIDNTWRKSSFSNARGECVEVANTSDHGAAVRDTQNRERGHLAFSLDEWAAFVRDVKSDLR